jgi:hypothetical protein
MTVGLPRLEGLPLLGLKDNLTGHRWLGTASPREVVETPRHAEGKRQGVPYPLLCLHAQLLHRTPWLQHSEKPCSVPPTARPLPHRARPGNIRPG